MPLLLQPVRAGGNPEVRRHVFHACSLPQSLYIYPVLAISADPNPAGIDALVRAQARDFETL